MTLKYSLKVPLIFMALSFSIASFSQKKVFRFDSKWRLVMPDKAVFTRMAALDTNRLTFDGKVWNNFSNGVQQMIGVYEKGNKEGYFEVFYPNTNTECKGLFRDNIPRGKWEFFWPNGNKKHLVRYDSLKAVILQSWDSLGTAIVTNGNGKFRHSFFDSRLQTVCIVEGRLVNSSKEGKWVCRDEQKNVVWDETYENNAFKSGNTYGKEGVKAHSTSLAENCLIPDFIEISEKFYIGDDKVLDEFPIFKTKGLIVEKVEQVYVAPSFKGGSKALTRFISDNLRLPESSENSPKGTVIVSFMVETNGALSDINIEKSVSPTIDASALELVKKMPNWIPAKFGDANIKRRVRVPIAVQ